MSFESFRELVQQWAVQGYLPEALAYGFVVNALLAGYGKAGDAASAEMLFKEMKERGVAPDLISFTTMLDLYGKAWQVEDVERW